MIKTKAVQHTYTYIKKKAENKSQFNEHKMQIEDTKSTTYKVMLSCNKSRRLRGGGCNVVLPTLL